MKSQAEFKNGRGLPDNGVCLGSDQGMGLIYSTWNAVTIASLMSPLRFHTRILLSTL